MGETIFQRGSWMLENRPEPPPELVDLLVNTIWGTPGKTRYQHLDTRQRIGQLQRPHYITLLRQGRVMAGMTLCRRATADQLGTANALYVRYLSVIESLRNQAPGRRAISPETPYLIRPGSFIKNQLFDLFNQPEIVAAPLPGTQHSFYYAFVESENQRSLQICRAFGFQPVRSFRTIPFSRFFPKRHPEVSRLQPSERSEVLAAVQRQYADYNLFFPDHLFLGDHYYVLRRDGKIVAGLRAMPVNWVIKHLPGLSGQITLRLVPHLPLLSRLFDPNDFRFAAFEGIFARPGYESELFTLMEAVLAELGLHTGMMWLDDQTEQFDFFFHSGRLGFLHRVERPSPVRVLIRFAAPRPDLLAAYRERPAYISALDAT